MSLQDGAESLAKHLRAQLSVDEEADVDRLIGRLRSVVKSHSKLGLLAFGIYSVELQNEEEKPTIIVSSGPVTATGQKPRLH